MARRGKKTPSDTIHNETPKKKMKNDEENESVTKIAELQERVAVLEAELKNSYKSLHVVIGLKNREIEQLRQKHTVDAKETKEIDVHTEAEEKTFRTVIAMKDHKIEQLREKIAKIEDAAKKSCLQPDLTIRMSLKKCSQLKSYCTKDGKENDGQVQFSQSKFHSGFEWYIAAGIEEDSDGRSYLNASVVCDRKNNFVGDWSCVASIRFQLICRSDDTKSVEITNKFRTFNRANDSCGSRFIDWKKLMDKTNGFINNDTVLLQADVQVFP